MTRAPIAVALDGDSLPTVTRWASDVNDCVSHLKVGLQTYLRDGAQGLLAVRDAAPDCSIFLDLKLHDIPATVAGACSSLASLHPDIVTVHAAGGAAMIAAAAETLPSTKIAAVTILTSLSDRDLTAVGFTGNAVDCVRRLATLAVSAGATALVCSPLEVAMVRAAVGPDILLITPGVRPADGDMNDQQRVATPARALADGADLLVIGRPITAAVSPREAATAIATDLGY
jgi:orotidine-5'-phosphate decarboxylase